MKDHNLFERINEKLIFSLRKRVPSILQSESSECGLACLAMISSYYGFNVDMLSLRQRFGISTQGATLGTISQIASQIQLKTRALSLDIDEVNQLKTPCVLHWNMNHFVVLVKVRRASFVIHDPAFGRRVIGLQEMSNHFTGIALELWPDRAFQKETLKTRLRLLDLMKNIEGLPGTLLKIFALSIVIESVNLLLPVGTQLVTDHVIQAHDYSLLTVICLGLIFFTLFRAVVSIARAWISIVLGTLTDIQWKTTLFEHLLKLPLDFFEKRHLGDIQSRFSSLDAIRTTFTNNIVSGIIDGIMTVGLFVMMMVYGGWLVWVVSGFTLVYILIRMMTYRTYRQFSEEQIVKAAKANSHFMETLYGVSTVKALGIKDTRSSYWLNLNVDAANTNIKITRFNMMFGGINTFITTLDQVAILWLGAMMVIDNSMTLGMFMAFNAYRGQFSQRASNLIDLAIGLRMLSLHNERISDIVFTDAEPESAPRQIFQPGKGVAVEVKNLTYQYDALSRPIFKDLDMCIAAGESVAVVGVSGAGKTTLLKVMCGLLSPTSGQVLADSMDIHKVGVNNYRNAIACVLQDDRLFSGSIAENISGFEVNADKALIVACAVHSNIHDEIMQMPMGYETLIGELGNGISGGQKQRLFIARALYRRPSVLFMDEATSHLDVENELAINRAISSLNITRVIVAHRKSTIDSADRVVVLGAASGDPASNG